MTRGNFFALILVVVITGIGYSLWPPATRKVNPEPSYDILTKLGYHVTDGAAPGYIEDRACATCHKSVADSYQLVGMSQSFCRPEPKRYIEDFENNHFYHA